MLRFLSDENFNNHIIHALAAAVPTVDIARVQEVGLLGADDPEVLAWAADAGRLLLTHDVSTMTDYAYDRVREGLAMPGVVEVPETLPIGRAIDDLILLAECSRENEWDLQVVFLPLH
jgi:hypothetical protein